MGLFKKKAGPASSDCSKDFLDPANASQKLPHAGDITKLVKLPQGMELNEWLATNTTMFFQNLKTIFGAVEEVCDGPSMTAGPKVEFVWTDEKGKKSKGLTAAQYIDLVFTASQKHLSDDGMFPTKYGSEFAKDFQQRIVKNEFRLYFHVFAHIYYSLFQAIVDLDMVSHLNFVFLHFSKFAQEYDLQDLKETAVLADLVKALEES